MAPESKDKKRKASETAAAKPSKKTKKSKSDEIPASVESKSQAPSNPPPTKPNKATSTAAKPAPLTKPAPAPRSASLKKSSTKEPTSEVLNAPSSKAKAPRKRAADFLNDSEASGKEDGGVKIAGKVNGAAKKEDGPQKKRQKSKKKKQDLDSVANGELDPEARVEETTTCIIKAPEVGKGKKKDKKGKKQMAQPKKDDKSGQSVELLGKGPSIEGPVAALKSRLAKTAEAGSSVSEKLKKAGMETLGKVAEALNPPALKRLDEHESENDESNDEEEEGDQTAALLKGFEDSAEEDSEEDDSSEDEKYEEGMDLPKLDISKSKQKKLEALKKKAPDGPGVIYIGRIPHGFYEHEMRAYFGQFGDIQQLRLSRNKKTGASKHYAFIEFASFDVASVAAQTMDHYLLFGHVLKCKVIPQDQIPKDLWKGANRRFNKVPWSKLEKQKLDKGKTKQGWEEKNKAEQKKRDEKQEKMKSFGYEFQMPVLKSPSKAAETSKEIAPSSDSSSSDEQDHEPKIQIKTAVVSKAKPTTIAVAKEVKTKKSTKKNQGKQDGQDGNQDKAPAINTNVEAGKSKPTGELSSKTADPEKNSNPAPESKVEEKLKNKKSKGMKEPISGVKEAGVKGDVAKSTEAPQDQAPGFHSKTRVVDAPKKAKGKKEKNSKQPAADAELDGVKQDPAKATEAAPKASKKAPETNVDEHPDKTKTKAKNSKAEPTSEHATVPITKPSSAESKGKGKEPVTGKTSKKDKKREEEGTTPGNTEHNAGGKAKKTKKSAA